MVRFKCPFGTPAVKSKQADPKPISNAKSDISAVPPLKEEGDPPSVTTPLCRPGDEEASVEADLEAPLVPESAMAAAL